jgi:hypothetical protein
MLKSGLTVAKKGEIKAHQSNKEFEQFFCDRSIIFIALSIVVFNSIASEALFWRWYT